MEKAPGGSSVGVDDPYAHVDRCDHLTDDGRCRWARERGNTDPEFADELRAQEFRCPVVADPEAETGDTTAPSSPNPAGEDLPGPWTWKDCPHFACKDHERACHRCGLARRPAAHSDEQPLLEEHHLSYTADKDHQGSLSHEITLYLCRWCHAKVHNSWARIDDDVAPDPEATAEREQRIAREHEELGFESAAKRFE
jgi:hypothetical protein